MAMAALDLALPWQPGPSGASRRAAARATPCCWRCSPQACVATGAVLHLPGCAALYFGSASRGLRLHGASNAGWLACLAFAGFAIALHEAVLRRRRGLAGAGRAQPA